MNSEVSGSEHYMQRLKALGGSENDVTEPHYLLTQDDTVESVVSHLVMEQRARGLCATDPAILHAAAEFLISRRNEHASGHGPAALQQGHYQLDIHCGGAGTTRESIPVKDLADAKVWAKNASKRTGRFLEPSIFRQVTRISLEWELSFRVLTGPWAGTGRSRRPCLQALTLPLPKRGQRFRGRPPGPTAATTSKEG